MKPGILQALLAPLLSVALGAGAALAGPVAIEARELSLPAADPFVEFVSVGPRHEYDPVYQMPDAGACPVQAYRILILGYAHYDNLVLEELAFEGSKCQDIRVRTSRTINGVKLGYSLGEGSSFARKIEFDSWEAWNIVKIRSSQRTFRILMDRGGKVTAERDQEPPAR